MKYLNGTEVLNGEPVVHMTAAGAPQVGLVQITNDKTNMLRITGYALWVNPAECVSAKDAYNAVASQSEPKEPAKLPEAPPT